VGATAVYFWQHSEESSKLLPWFSPCSIPSTTGLLQHKNKKEHVPRVVLRWFMSLKHVTCLLLRYLKCVVDHVDMNSSQGDSRKLDSYISEFLSSKLYCVRR
jgi:hypothetical protein